MDNKLELLLNKEFNKSIENKNEQELEIFVIKAAQEYIRLGNKIPKPKLLWGNLIKKGKLVVIFGDNGSNKSTLAVQICDGISKGINQLGLEYSKGKVILLDGEMDTQSFAERYSRYEFNDNFIRIEINFQAFLDSDLPMEKLVFQGLRKYVEKYKPDLLIVDNLTYLSSGSKEQSKEIIDLLRSVFYFTKQFNTAVVLIGHVPKLEANKPLLKEHLSGSKVLTDLVDNAIGISTSIRDKNIRYIKELKNRGSIITFDKDNVMVCEISDKNRFLHLELIGTSTEAEHLHISSKEELNYEKIMELKEAKLSNVKIAKMFGVNDKTIGNIIRKNS